METLWLWKLDRKTQSNHSEKLPDHMTLLLLKQSEKIQLDRCMVSQLVRMLFIALIC